MRSCTFHIYDLHITLHLCPTYFWYVLIFVLHILQKVDLWFWSRRSVVHDVLHISHIWPSHALFLCALYFWYVLNFVLHFLQKVHLCFWSRRSVVYDVLHISHIWPSHALHLCPTYFWYVLNAVLQFLQKVHLCFWRSNLVVYDFLHSSHIWLFIHETISQISMYYAETRADNSRYANHRVICLVVMGSSFDSEQVFQVSNGYLW